MANEIKRLIKSFGHALQGLKVLFSSQKNAVIHFCLMLVSVVFVVLLNISSIECVLIIICSGMVMAAEAFNTALEKMADTVHPEKNDGIGSAKDLAAGSVLITAIAALVVGIIIFAPKLHIWIKSI